VWHLALSAVARELLALALAESPELAFAVASLPERLVKVEVPRLGLCSPFAPALAWADVAALELQRVVQSQLEELASTQLAVVARSIEVRLEQRV